MLNITELTCRVCLEEQNVLIHIYDELEELHTNLSRLLETCVKLQIDENDDFPKYLCEDCTRELLITSKFHEKCHKSKELLNEILESAKLIEYEEMSNPNDIIEFCLEETSEPQVEDFIIEENDIISSREEEKEIIENTTDVEQPEVSMSLLRKHTNEIAKETELPSALETETIPKECLNQMDLETKEFANTDLQTVTMSWDNEALVLADDENINSSSTKPLSLKLRNFHIFKCDICGALFKQAINLQKHLQKSHDPVHCFSCTKCDHWFSVESEFYKHVENCNYLETSVVDNEEKKKVKTVFGLPVEQDHNRKCLYCDREFPTPFALRMHMRTHTGERPFRCKYCTKSFKTQSQLNVHHKRHIGQADFICTICNKTFYEQSNLTVHMRSHTGERPHVCTVCNKTFTRVFLLQFHIRTHTGEKPYKCSYCDKCFRQHTDLRSHLTTHTGQKQHNCLLCGKSYIKRSHLVQHMRKHQLPNDVADSGDKEQFEHDQGTDELCTSTDNIQNYVQNSEVLYSFDEIIESEDVVSQSDVIL